jgi:hypothetical protein
MNINAVIAHLVEMTPPQRKQFAQMHMDDPMMLSAAKFVDNQISKQAAAMSAQQMGAAPPPVNQQVVAQMSPQPPAPQAAPMPQATPQPQGQAQPLPENTGIAQLPAQNMKGMADGGIVGYADGGTTNVLGQELDQYGYPVPMYKGAVRAIKSSIDDVGSLIDDFRASPKYQNYREMVDNPYGYTGNSGPHPRNMPTVVTTAAPATVPPPPTVLGTGSGQGTRGMPVAKKGIQQVLPDDGGAQPASKPTITDRDYGAMYSDMLKAQGDPRASIPKEIQEAQDLTKAQSDLEAASADKRATGLASLVATRDARLAGREGRLKEQEDLNPNMSLITAGLAMMQSTGKGLAGIGEGAAKGMAQYLEGVKYNTSQRQKLEDARDAMDELKFNQENMTEKERNAARRIAMEGAVAAKNATLQFIQHKEGVDHKTADTLLKAKTDALLTADEQRFRASESALGRANQVKIANMLPAEARMAMLAGSDTTAGNQLTAGLGKISDIGTEARMYKDWTTGRNDPLNGPQFKVDFPTFADYLAGRKVTGGGGTMANPNWKNYNVK